MQLFLICTFTVQASCGVCMHVYCSCGSIGGCEGGNDHLENETMMWLSGGVVVVVEVRRRH